MASVDHVQPEITNQPEVSNQPLLPNECSICLDPMNSPVQSTPITLLCTHSFHSSCLEPWAKVTNQCPLCRQPVDPKQDTRPLNLCDEEEDHRLALRLHLEENGLLLNLNVLELIQMVRQVRARLEESRDVDEVELEEDISPREITDCQYCGNSEETLRCSGCHRTYYCSEECQHADWDRHQRFCSSPEDN